MTALSDYVTGTISLTNGEVEFTGAATGWLLAGFKEGDTIIDITGATEFMGVVATIDANGAGTLTKAWEGPTLVNASYRMRYHPDGARVSAQARNLIELLGNGNLVAFAGLNGSANRLPMFTGPGAMTLVTKQDLVSGAAYDVQVDDLAARAAYDGQDEGYSVLVANTGDGRAAIYSKASNASADWSDPAYVTGPVGPLPTVTVSDTETLAPGEEATVTPTPIVGGVSLAFGIPAGRGMTPRGNYNPVTAYVLDDAVLYNGSSWIALGPTTGNAPPTLPATSNTYWQLLARAGTDGAGTVTGLVAGTDIDIDASDPTQPVISSLAPNKNLFHNPVIRTHQRGASFTSTTVPANNDGNYLIDGIVLLSDGNDVVDVSRISLGDPVGAVYALALDVETVNKKFGIFMPIEVLECWEIIGGTATLSFEAKVSSTTKLDNLKAAIVSWTGTVDAPTKDIVSAWGAEGTNPTLVTNWNYESAPVNLGPSTSFQRFEITAAIDTPGVVNVGIFIWSDVTDTTLGDFLYITRVKLEQGNKATSCIPDPVAVERARCYRYLYRRSAISATDILGMMQAVSTSLIFGGPFVTFPVPMRVIPTVMRSDIAHLGTYSAAGSGPSNLASGTFLATERGVGSLSGLTVSGSPMTAGQGAMLIFSNAFGFIEATAELGV